MVSGVVLVQFPEINPVAIYGIAAMLGIAGKTKPTKGANNGRD